MEGDLDKFKEVLLADAEAELKTIKDNLAYGICVNEHTPYEYWWGQCVVYMSVIEMIKSKYKRLAGEAFQGEDDDD